MFLIDKSVEKEHFGTELEADGSLREGIRPGWGDNEIYFEHMNGAVFLID